jgi:hypothetical protein
MESKILNDLMTNNAVISKCVEVMIKHHDNHGLCTVVMKNEAQPSYADYDKLEAVIIQMRADRDTQIAEAESFIKKKELELVEAKNIRDIEESAEKVSNIKKHIAVAKERLFDFQSDNSDLEKLNNALYAMKEAVEENVRYEYQELKKQELIKLVEQIEPLIDIVYSANFPKIGDLYARKILDGIMPRAKSIYIDWREVEKELVKGKKK